MNQKINLYQQLPKSKKDWLTARFITELNGILLIILFIITAASFWQNHLEGKKLVVFKQEQKEMADRLLKVSKQYPKATKDAALEENISELAQKVETKSQIVDALTEIGTNNSTGFSIYLTRLGEDIPDGLWLTNIELHRGGQDITLIGKAYIPALVPQFIHNLRKTMPFNDKQFEIFEISKTDKTPGETAKVTSPENAEGNGTPKAIKQTTPDTLNFILKTHGGGA